MTEDGLGHCLYHAHSVIEEAGELYDITLKDQAQCDPILFLPHTGTDKEFWAVEKNHSQTHFPFPTFEEMCAIGSEGVAEDEDGEL